MKIKPHEANQPVIDKRCLSEAEAAVYLNVSRSALRQGRMDGPRENRMPPPPFVKVGRKIAYLIEDLDGWLKANRVDLYMGGENERI